MHYVIIGAGPAGVIAAETLRKTDPEGKITLIGDEPEPPYSRMAIPYLLVDDIREEGTHLRKGIGHYDVLGINIVQGQVTALDREAKQLSLDSGENISYDKVLIASGSRPVLPPVPGIDSPQVLNCWTMEDARNILEHATPGKKVVLIGAGFIGCIILESLVKRGVDLTVVEMGDRMVPRMMDETAGGLIKGWCESRGVKVHTATQVTAINAQTDTESGGFLGFFTTKTSAKHPLKVDFNNGQSADADLVISAAGVKPNIEFLDGTGIETDIGVMVNQHFQSNDESVYASGDVAQGRDFSTGTYEVHAIQPTASEHGRCAALNMAGVETSYPGSFNMNVLDTVGLISSSFGLWMGTKGGDSAELIDAENFRYLNLQFKDDVLVGATCLGLTEHVGILRGLIQGKTPLGPWKQRLKDDPTRLMEAWLARHQEHAA